MRAHYAYNAVKTGREREQWSNLTSVHAHERIAETASLGVLTGREAHAFYPPCGAAAVATAERCHWPVAHGWGCRNLPPLLKECGRDANAALLRKKGPSANLGRHTLVNPPFKSVIFSPKRYFFN